MKLFLGLIATAGAMIGTSASAATTLYSNSTTFNSAAGSVSSVGFQGCPGGSSLSSGQAISSSTGPCSGIASGVTFSTSSNGNLYIASAGQSANTTTALGLDTPIGGTIVITLSNLATAFGADLFQNLGGGSQGRSAASFVISLLNGTSLVNTYNVSVAPNTGSFFGITDSAAFNKVTISETNGFAVIDNVRFNKATAAVPEPATWAMMLIGFGGIGAVMRRRAKVRTKVSFG